MPIQAFVSRDATGQPWPPDHSHEVQAALELLRMIWQAFHDQTVFYAVLANLHHPNADLVVLSERGLGVVELKHYYGRIAIAADGTWYANHIPIKAGQHYATPHHQVQSYAQHIRERFIPYLTQCWSTREKAQWEAFRLQTAVCFTHPDAQLDDGAKHAMERHCRPNTYGWEDFRILTPDNVGDWVAALRFEVDRGRPYQFEPYRLTPSHLAELATQVLGGTEWDEIAHLMPTGSAYAYLFLVEHEKHIMSFPLIQEDVLLGRDTRHCTYALPERYSRVSRKHARLTRTAEGVFLEDLESRYGTFVNGRRIRHRFLLSHGHRIMLGGKEGSEDACILEFGLKADTDIQVASTQASSRKP